MKNISLIFLSLFLVSKALALNPCVPLMKGLLVRQNASLVESISTDPWAFWKKINERASKFAMENPLKSREFPVPEFSHTLEYMIQKLEIASMEFRASNRQEKLNLSEEVLRDASAMKGQITYERFVLLSFFFSQVMEFRYVEKLRGVELQGRSPIDCLKSFGERFQNYGGSWMIRDLLSRAPNFIMVPTEEDLGISPFLKVRALPIYFFGLPDAVIHADGVEFYPYGFFDHDLTHNNFTLLHERTLFGGEPKYSEAFLRSRHVKVLELLRRMEDIQDIFLRRAVEIGLFEVLHEGSLAPEQVLPYMNDEFVLHIVQVDKDNKYSHSMTLGSEAPITARKAMEWIKENINEIFNRPPDGSEKIMTGDQI